MEKRNGNYNLEFHFQRSGKTENENGLRILFFDGMGKWKTKLKVRIAFSHIVGKRLALRYTHSIAPAVIASSFTDLFTNW